MAHYISQPRIEGPIWLEPNDISFLHTQTAETEKGVETLEEQISKLTHEYEIQMSRLKHQYDYQLFELTRQKDEKLIEMSSLRNILSPIRRIPVEILSEILELSCIPEDGEFTADCGAFLCASLVSSVCVAWRKTVLADARLWSTICLDLQQHCKGDMLVGLKNWISRSQGYSLDLYLDLRTNDHLLQSKAEQVLECILDFRHQIRSISVRFTTISLPLFHLPRSSLPLLEKVFFDVYVESEFLKLRNLFPHGVEAFSGAPKLKHVGIDEVGYTSILEVFVLPLEQLASLEIESDPEGESDFASYQHTLFQCKNLVSFTTDLCAGFSLDFSICLPALVTLDMTCHQVLDTTRTASLLHGLTTPFLEHLTLRWRDQDIQSLCTDLVGLQSRSSAPLSSLTLIMENSDNNITPAMDFVNRFTLILAAFPTVRSFQLRGYEEQRNQCPLNALIQPMIYSRDRRLVLPNLTYFELRILADSEFPPDMAPMLSSRRCPYAVDNTYRVPQPDVVVSRFYWDDQPTAQYIDIMESQCIVP